MFILHMAFLAATCHRLIFVLTGDGPNWQLSIDECMKKCDVREAYIGECFFEV